MSEPFIWQPEYELGYPLMDDDHKQAVLLIETIRQASIDGSPELKDMLITFADHCAHHFSREESVMMQTGFPAFQFHKQEHDRVLNELEDMVQNFENLGEDERRPFLEQGLKDWLLQHLATMDTVTANFIKSAVA